VLLVDTGPLLATADRDDAHHLVCRSLLEGHDGQLVTTATSASCDPATSTPSRSFPDR
jgi:hypothetical protein